MTRALVHEHMYLLVVIHHKSYLEVRSALIFLVFRGCFVKQDLVKEANGNLLFCAIYFYTWDIILTKDTSAMVLCALF